MKMIGYTQIHKQSYGIDYQQHRLRYSDKNREFDPANRPSARRLGHDSGTAYASDCHVTVLPL